MTDSNEQIVRNTVANMPPEVLERWGLDPQGRLHPDRFPAPAMLPELAAVEQAKYTPTAAWGHPEIDIPESTSTVPACPRCGNRRWEYSETVASASTWDVDDELGWTNEHRELNDGETTWSLRCRICTREWSSYEEDEEDADPSEETEGRLLARAIVASRL